MKKLAVGAIAVIATFKALERKPSAGTPAETPRLPAATKKKSREASPRRPAATKKKPRKAASRLPAATKKKSRKVSPSSKPV